MGAAVSARGDCVGSLGEEWARGAGRMLQPLLLPFSIEGA